MFVRIEDIYLIKDSASLMCLLRQDMESRVIDHPIKTEWQVWAPFLFSFLPVYGSVPSFPKYPLRA